jgi:hypothetical protein
MATPQSRGGPITVVSKNSAPSPFIIPPSVQHKVDSIPLELAASLAQRGSTPTKAAAKGMSVVDNLTFADASATVIPGSTTMILNSGNQGSRLAHINQVVAAGMVRIHDNFSHLYSGTASPLGSNAENF